MPDRRLYFAAMAIIALVLPLMVLADSGTERPLFEWSLSEHLQEDSSDGRSVELLSWQGGSAPAVGADGAYIFDGTQAGTINLKQSLGGEIAVDISFVVHEIGDGISNYLVSAFHQSEPQAILWGLRLNGDTLELVKRLQLPDGKTRYKSITWRRKITPGQAYNVTATVGIYKLSMSVDGRPPRYTYQYFPVEPVDSFGIGCEADGRIADRRFRGRIDRLVIAAPTPHEIVAREHDGRAYVLIDVPAKDSRFPGAPARVQANLHRLREVMNQADSVSPERLRLVEWDKQTNSPKGERVPLRHEYDLYTGHITLGWLRDESGAATYGLYLADEQDGGVLPGEVIPLVGAGEPVSVGRTDYEADLGQLLAGTPSAVDWDRDGDLDLVVGSVIPRRVWLFENTASSQNSEPELLAPRMIYGGASLKTHAMVQLDDGSLQIYRVARGGKSLEILRDSVDSHPRQLETLKTVSIENLPEEGSIFDVHVTDLDGDGAADLLLSIIRGPWWWPDGVDPWNGGNGNPKIGYGRGYDDRNKWLGEPPIGSFCFVKNLGTTSEPRFAAAEPITAGGEPISLPTTQLAASLIDIDDDGDLDLLTAVDVDRFMVFEKSDEDGHSLDYDLPRNALRDTQVSRWSYFDSRFAVSDWDGDGNDDVLICSNPGVVVLCRIEGGYLIEEKVLKAKAANIWAETLVVPAVGDFNDDGVWDVIMGDASGFLSYFQNSGTAAQPLFKNRQKLTAAGEVFRPVAGYSGSIQGPDEARWGYLAPTVADWDNDGVWDVVCSDITGYVCWMKNTGGQQDGPDLMAPEPIRVGTWPLKVRWRTRPAVIQGEGPARLITSDEDGYLCLYERDPMLGPSHVKPAEPILDEDGQRIKLDGPSGYNGRAKLLATDWDRDGTWDLLVGQPIRSGISLDHPYTMPRHPAATVVLLRNVGTNAKPVMAEPQILRMANGEAMEFGNHACAPAVHDIDGDGWDDLLLGVERGFMNYYHRSLFEDNSQLIRLDY